MTVLKCENCEKEIHWRGKAQRAERARGWTATGKSKWGKQYDRRSGWAWWCPDCRLARDAKITSLPEPVIKALKARGNGDLPEPGPRMVDVAGAPGKQLDIDVAAFHIANGLLMRNWIVESISAMDLERVILAILEDKSGEAKR